MYINAYTHIHTYADYLVSALWKLPLARESCFTKGTLPSQEHLTLMTV